MVSYNDYLDLFPAGLSEEQFSNLMPSALAYIDSITANRARGAVGYKAQRVKQAVCAVINEMAAQNASRGEGGARVLTVSNDGYSESYGGMNSAESESSTLRSVALRYLSGTGLAGAL